MAPEKEELRKEFETTDIKLKALAEKYGVNYQTVKSWKSREGWQKVATSGEKVATESERLQPKKRGAPKGSKNALGNRGGAPKGNKNAVGNGAPGGNANAVKHGFFRKYFPDDEETQELLNEAEAISPADILWINIKTQFMAIIRAQKIMFVADHDDLTKEIKKIKSRESEQQPSSKEIEFEIQFAWDKYSVYLNGQARAMSELRSTIKDFLAVSGQDDKRRLELEQMQKDIELKQAQIAKLQGVDEGVTEDDGFLDALKGEAGVWDDGGQET